MRLPRAAVACALLIAAAGTSLLFAQVAVKHFRPPRTAVVDTFEVIELYKKKEVLELELKAEVEAATREVEALDRRAKTIEAELKIIDEGTPEHRKKVLEKTEIGLQLADLKVKIRRQLEERQMQAIQQIRDEVDDEIRKYAENNDLDLVIEKKIPIEGRGAKINIPITRFAKPEIEITREIANILNERYARVTRKP